MDTKEFLRTILPSEGVHFIVVQTDQGFRHKGFTSLDEAADFALVCDAKGLTTYHACAAYRSKPYTDEKGTRIVRTRPNWLSAKAFWCDIDCGAKKAETGSGYATQKEGATALLSWCQKKGLPFPMLVNSGRGVHAYWALTQSLEATEWIKYATALKGLMQNDGILVDPTRSADFASILRPIGTHNRKDPSKPKVVKLAMAAKPVETESFLAKVSELVANSDAPLAAPPAWMTQGEDMQVEYADVACSADLCADKCHQMAVIRDTQGDGNYEHWRGVIGVLKHCENGLETAKAWSARRAETGHGNTDVEKRYETWTSGPATCEFFEKCNPEGCKDCPFKGKIKTPLVLGRVEPKSEPDQVPGVLENDANQTELLVEIPELPQGYKWTGEHLVKYIPNKDGVLEAHPFSRTRFYLIERIRNAEYKFEFIARAHLPKGVVREFTIPGTLVGAGGSKLLELLGSYEVFTTSAKDATMIMHAYIKDQVAALMESRTATSTHTAFGWQGDGSFLIGRRLHKPDGKVVDALLSGYAAATADRFPTPRGSVSSYAEKINWIYNREGMEPMQYFICSLWASPLVELAEPLYNGIPCALTGADSGKGKTTAALAALYAYGDAQGLSISGDKGATEKAQSALLGAVSNLPVLFDEVTNKDPKSLSRICYALSNGLEGMRLQLSGGGVNFAQRESWRLQAGMTGNSHITAQLAMNGNTEAEAMRIFEIRIDAYNTPKLDPLAVSAALMEIERNQGVAGEKFIHWIVTHRDEAARMLRESYSLIKAGSDLMVEPKFRFYRNHIAVTLTGAQIMKMLKVIDFDIQKMADFAVEAASDLVRENMDFNSFSPEECLSRMISDLSPRILSTPTMVPVGVNGEPYKAVLPNGLVGRWIKGNDFKRDKHDGHLYLSSLAVREWCVQRRVDLAKLTKELVNLKILLSRGERITLGKGTTIASSQQRCWDLDMKKIEGDNDGGK